MVLLQCKAGISEISTRVSQALIFLQLFQSCLLWPEWSMENTPCTTLSSLLRLAKKLRDTKLWLSHIIPMLSPLGDIICIIPVSATYSHDFTAFDNKNRLSALVNEFRIYFRRYLLDSLNYWHSNQLFWVTWFSLHNMILPLYALPV